MEKFVSLADVLGVDHSSATGEKPEGEAQPSKPSAPLHKKQSVKKMCKEILASSEYREHLYRMIVMDQIPAQLEQMLYHYAEGKPVERLEVSEAPQPLEDASVEQLEDRITRLHEQVKLMRQAEPAEEEGRDGDGQVH